ncbi:MAG TPA: YIP1 family protein [Gaiellaceae bacterium]|nr:YIP1 family protein [Gaiellaceae bacterium]
MAEQAAQAPSALERSWWLRAPAVLVAPRAVFASLRDESDEAVEARQDPLAALIGLAGFASVLATPVARSLLDDFDFSVVLIPVWTFFGGAGYALAVDWIGGALLFGASRRLGGLGSYLRSRHVVALASAPLALTLVAIWPLRIAIYGEDLFRTGGTDWGPGDRIFGGFVYAAAAWSILLLLVGVRTVHGWGWGRTLTAVALAAALPALVVLATIV